jgi:hypothetical protein
MLIIIYHRHLRIIGDCTPLTAFDGAAYGVLYHTHERVRTLLHYFLRPDWERLKHVIKFKPQ